MTLRGFKNLAMLSIKWAAETSSAAACKRWEARPVKIKPAIAHDKMGGLHTVQDDARILCHTALGYAASAGVNPKPFHGLQRPLVQG